MKERGLDTSVALSRHNLRLLGQLDMHPHGDGMHINVREGVAYFAHQGSTGTSIIDVRDPREPFLLARLDAPENTHSHKVQVVDDILLVNRERNQPRFGGRSSRSWTAGLSVYDVSNPRSPFEIGYWPAGGRGVHRMTYWSGRYAYVSAGAPDLEWEGLSIVDLADPAAPVQVGRWCLPGMHRSESSSRTWNNAAKVTVHHGIPRGSYLYCGVWDAGAAVLDIADPASPRMVSHVNVDAIDGPSVNTHSFVPLPGRDVAVMTDEKTEKHTIEFHARLFDISDPAMPRFLSRFPVPPRPKDGYDVGRFGPHNVHEPRPGSFQSGDLVFMTYFNAGIRVFDVRDPHGIVEVAHYIPKPPRGCDSTQFNDVHVDSNGLIYVSDRGGGGLYIFELDDDALDG